MTAKCSEAIYEPNGWGRTRQCSRSATVTEGGQAWCKQHAPSVAAARRDAALAKVRTDMASDERKWKRANLSHKIAQAALAALAASPASDVTTVVSVPADLVRELAKLVEP